MKHRLLTKLKFQSSQKTFTNCIRSFSTEKSKKIRTATSAQVDVIRRNDELFLFLKSPSCGCRTIDESLILQATKGCCCLDTHPKHGTSCQSRNPFDFNLERLKACPNFN